jgi:hypothetical protein
MFFWIEKDLLATARHPLVTCTPVNRLLFIPLSLLAIGIGACTAQKNPTTSGTDVSTVPITSATASAPTIAPAGSGSAPDPTASSSSAPSTSASSTGDTGGPAPDGGVADTFTACTQDSDCVAVPMNGCCQNGWNVAVASSQSDAYKASFTCAKRQPCPMYVVNDKRTPRCNAQSKHCELIQPSP